MNTDIFIKTYPDDYKWLPYLFASIEKFAEGFRHIVVVSEEPDSKEQPFILAFLPSEAKFPVKLHITNEIPQDGVRNERAVRMMWPAFTDAKEVLHLDSDMVFNQPVSPDSWCNEKGQPLWFVATGRTCLLHTGRSMSRELHSSPRGFP
jgi:hypothetical protein